MARFSKLPYLGMELGNWPFEIITPIGSHVKENFNLFFEKIQI